MIKKVEMFSIDCDKCEERYVDDNTGISARTDEGTIWTDAMEDGWVEQDGKQYCTGCQSDLERDEDGDVLEETTKPKLFCSMKGKGFCMYEKEGGVCCVTDINCVNQVSKI